MILEPRSIPEFVRIEGSGQSALVHPDFADHVAPALFDESRLQPTAYFGRGVIRSLETPHGTVLVRQCRRGGDLKNLFRDKYLLHNRPRQEIELHREAYARGVHTVLPVGACWSRSGVFFRGSVATLKVDADDLYHKVKQGGGALPEELAACGRAIRSMHAAGVLHADLNMKNLLVHGSEAWVIDFDKGRIVSDVGNVHARANFLRLRRSMVNHANILMFDAIVEAYEAAGGVPIPL